MRDAFAETLVRLAAQDERVVLLTGDVGFGVFDKFQGGFAGRFYNIGVAEQNMTGIAAGLALSGKIVFTYSMANFPTIRCLEQIRNDVCYHDANVKIVSVGAGLAYGPLGATHHGTEDIAVLRALPGMVVFSPADAVEARWVTEAAYRHDGPCYLRLGRAGEPCLHERVPAFEIGKAVPIRSGSDATVIATGSIVGSALEASKALSTKRVSLRVLSMPTIKPIDEDAILLAALETRAVVTVEEHGAIGGLGSAVEEVLAENPVRAVPFRKLSLGEQFCRQVGTQAWLRDALGLTPRDIAQTVEELLRGG